MIGDWIIHTINKQILFEYTIGINKPIPGGIIIPSSEIIESRFYIIEIPPIAEGLDSAQGGSERAGGGERLAPRIVSILYHFVAVAVNDSDNIALEIMNVSILRAVELHHSGVVLGVIPEVERSAAAGHMNNILSMENIIGCRRSTAYRHLFLYPETISGIFVFRCSADRATCSIGLFVHPNQLAQGVIGIAYICSAYAITASYNVFQMNGKNGEFQESLRFHYHIMKCFPVAEFLPSAVN